MTAYNESFFKDGADHVRKSADVVAPLMMEWMRPRSVVDVGCALGQWLAAFKDHGVETILGMDGDYVDRAWLQIPRECFLARDLAKPVDAGRTFDLAICLEVAEHLPKESADVVVASLTKLSPVVLFSAAVPHQGGVEHLNEQWQEYWIGQFAKQKYVAIDCVRPRIWENPNVRWWYAQNTMVYVRESALDQYPLLAAMRNERMPASLVHPAMYLGLHYYTEPGNVTLKNGARFFLNVLRHSMGRRYSKLTGRGQA